MTRARASWYDGERSRPREVEVAIVRAAGALSLVVHACEPPGEALASYGIATVALGDRIGSAPRHVELPDGGALDVLDNAAFDALLASERIAVVGRAIGRLEDRWRHAVVAIVLVVLSTVGFMRYGVPALAARAVELIPIEVDAKIGAGGLRLLDERLLSPSQLPAARRDELRSAFGAIAAETPGGTHYRLEFRAGGIVGPNAFALPSGVVVMTDEIVLAAQHDDELRAVLAHEVGHLVHRHSMRLLVQNSASALFMIGLVGDVSATSTLVAGVPTVLVQAKHSRDFEREADDYALVWMARAGVEPRRLGDLLARLSAAEGGDDWSWASSHPSVAERVARARR